MPKKLYCSLTYHAKQRTSSAAPIVLGNTSLKLLNAGRIQLRMVLLVHFIEFVSESISIDKFWWKNKLLNRLNGKTKQEVRKGISPYGDIHLIDQIFRIYVKRSVDRGKHYMILCQLENFESTANMRGQSNSNISWLLEVNYRTSAINMPCVYRKYETFLQPNLVSLLTHVFINVNQMSLAIGHTIFVAVTCISK